MLINNYYNISDDAEKQEEKVSGAYAYTWQEEKGGVLRYIVMMFTSTRAKKATNYYAYSSDEKRQAGIEDFFEGRIAYALTVKTRREQNNKPTTLKVGDVMYSSWGYDQTNIDFYQVTKVIGKRKIELRELNTDLKPTDYCGMSGHRTPKKDDFYGEAFTKMAVNNAIKITSCQSAWLWDGKPKLCSWYA